MNLISEEGYQPAIYTNKCVILENVQLNINNKK